MRKTTGFAVAALVGVFVLGIAACGSPSTTPDARATLEVASMPAADIWIDGEWKGSTPISITLDPGTHDLTLRQGGFTEIVQTVRLAAGEQATVDEVLIAQDMDDPNVVAHLARAFDVTVEPFEAPEQHRGGRRAPVAMLLWPQKDVRAEGLDTFGVEVSEYYEGDGYLVFRKGRTILYKEPFDPDHMTTIATIPLSVLQEVDVGDNVTWGIAYDSRRKKGVEARFRVVNKPKADRRLEKLARDRHLARQPAVTRAMVTAKALENYRLYTEALVSYLEIAQEDATSMQPYQGIVTTLRRLDAKESRLWGIASQYVTGSGRARAGKTGIAAFAPRNAKPLAPPIPTASAGVAGTPGRLGPGDAVTPGMRGTEGAGEPPAAPAAAAPPTADTGDLTTPAAAGGGAMVERFQRLSDQAAMARAEADTLGAHAEDAARHAGTTGEFAAEAEARLQRAADALEEAERAHGDDPTEETQAEVEAARHELAEAQGQRDEAAAAATQAMAEAERARNDALRASEEAERFEAEAAEARKAAEAAGIDLPETGTPGAEAPMSVRDKALEAVQTARNAEAEYAALRDAAERTGDADLARQADEALARMEDAKLVADAALRAYHDSGATEPLGDPGATTTAEEAVKTVMQDKVDEAKNTLEDARRALQDARNATDRDPADQAAADAFAEAEARLTEAEQAHERALDSYRMVVGEEGE